MTLAQLQSFVLVARHGSVKAAAAELEVTEPAVSVAVAALRKELGDELFVRNGRGIALTPGGRRLAALASEILGLAEQARRSVASGTESRRLVVAATSLVAEHVGPLIEMYAARDEELEVEVAEMPGGAFAEALEHRRADIALGPAIAGETIASAPFLRCRLIIAAAPSHPLAGGKADPSLGEAGGRPRRELAPSDLADEHWLVSSLDPSEGAGAFLARHGLSPRVSTFSSGAAAVAAAAAGEGIVLTLAHAVADEVRRRALVRLDVRGTPILEMWHASTLGLGRALPAALALQRFATTPEATQAISSGRVGAVSTGARAKPHVTLWAGR